MKKLVEQYIPKAIEAVKEKLCNDAQKTKVFEEYDGYAASLGAAIITSGLKTAISFYTDPAKEKKGDNKKPYRYKLLQAICYVLHENGEHTISCENKTGLLDNVRVLNASDAEKEMKQKILAASIAVKLALRGFNHVKSPKK